MYLTSCLALYVLQARQCIGFSRSNVATHRHDALPSATTFEIIPSIARYSSSSKHNLSNASEPSPVEEKRDTMSKVAALQKQAKRARLEAERMDISLTMKKIRDLEKKLESDKISPEESENIKIMLAQLSRKLQNPGEVVTPPINKKEVSLERDDSSSESMVQNTRIFDKQVEEEQTQRTINAWKKLSSIELRIRRIFLNAEDLDVNDIDNFVRTIWNQGPSVRNALRETESIAWNLTKVDPRDVERFSAMSDDELKDQYKTSREVFFEIIELEKASDRDEVTDEMAAGLLERIFSSSMKDELRRQGVAEEDIDTWVDPRMQPVLNLIPEAALFNKPKQQDINDLFRLIVTSNAFVPTSKPEKVPGGYIIRGQPRVDGDELISKIDSAIGDLSNKLNYFYVADPVEKSFEEISALEAQMEFGDATLNDLENPLILVTGPDITQESQPSVQALAFAIGLVNVAYFSFTSFPDDTFTLQNSLTLLLPMLGLQIVHDLAHKIVAWKSKIKSSLPVFVPGGGIGLYGTVTDIESSPKNRQSLFDYAVSGPLVGMSFSIALLIAGLLQTVSVDASSFPAVPVEFLRLSTLAGEILQRFYGKDLFLTSSPDTLIQVHPWVLAAYIGILTNGLNLLPLKVTDGGRMVQALLGRTFSKLPESITFFSLFLSGFFGKDELNVLLLYACFVSFFVGEKEVPCRNEISDIDGVRGTIGSVGLLLAVLAVTPLG